MDFTLLITQSKTMKCSCIVRGNRNFIQKILRQVFEFSSNEILLVFSENTLEKSNLLFNVHENYNSVNQDIEYLESIQKVLSDIAKFQTEEYVKILRDSIIQIGKTLKKIEKNFSE